MRYSNRFVVILRLVKRREFKRGGSPSFYKQIPLPIIKGKGTQGIGLSTLVSIGVFSAQPDAEEKEHQPT
jgi:hypothetical protein